MSLHPRSEKLQILLSLGIWAMSLEAIILFIPIDNWLIRIGIFLLIFGFSLPLFVVIVPEVAGLVLFDLFNGENGLIPIGPGLHFKFPWEIVHESNFFSLELVSKRFKQTYATSDGPVMKVEATYQYQPELSLLHKYRTVNESTIQEGLTDIIGSILSGIISEKKSEDARKRIKDMSDEVLEKLKEIEGQYGIRFELFTIADIDFSDDYQKARAGKANIGPFIEMANRVQKETGIDAKDAVNVVLLKQGDATKKKIFEIEGLAKIAESVFKVSGRGDAK